jgi:(Z)-2-((N-methylformamido)methylene)-5-hydroxybutyrolactone dehydrogenase
MLFMTVLQATDQPRYTLFIDGRRVEAASGRRYDSVDPFLGQPWASAADGDADRLAEIETRDTGKLLREMRGQLGSIPEWFYYFSGPDQGGLGRADRRHPGPVHSRLRGNVNHVPFGTDISPNETGSDATVPARAMAGAVAAGAGLTVRGSGGRG